jgi:hypothetical protein
VLGSAVPKEVWHDRLLKLKEIGCNGIRMSHNPQATDLYDLCDELGMLVMDEAFDEWEYPKKKWIKGWNKGDPGFQGAADYFREWGVRDLQSIITRDRNHPSIIMWSIGNEVDYPNDPYSHPALDTKGIGQIHVSGYKKSQPHADRLGDIAKDTIKTSDRPYAIEASASKSVLEEAMDVSIINLKIVDENGIPVYLADSEVTCTVDGPAKLLGLENASNNVAENFRDNRQRCKTGRLVAYIQATGKSGQVEVTFTAPLLQKAVVKIECQ